MRLYVEYVVRATNEETRNAFLRSKETIDSVKENFSEEIAKGFIINHHNMIRENCGFENKIFCFAKVKNEDEIVLLFFNKEPDNNVYYTQSDEDGKPYIEVEED